MHLCLGLSEIPEKFNELSSREICDQDENPERCVVTVEAN